MGSHIVQSQPTHSVKIRSTFGISVLSMVYLLKFRRQVGTCSYLKSSSRVRVSLTIRHKKGPPSPRAGAGQENIETVHEPKPIQTAGSPWGQGRRAMRGPHGPQTQVPEGACAIKVSMRC